MSQVVNRADLTALGDRMGHLLLLRVGIGSVVVAFATLQPGALGIDFTVLAGATAAYLAVAALGEAVRRRTSRFGYAILTSLLLLDGVYLAAAMYGTGGMQSPIRFLVYLHLVAVSLLASYRTGLKIALWHSLLFFVVLYAQAALLIPAVDVAPGVTPGASIAFARMPVLNVTAFWLFALATSVFSALNERELRLRRGDLQTLVDIGTILDDVRDPVLQSRIVLEALVERFGFRRGAVLGATEGRVIVLAAHQAAVVPTTAEPVDSILGKSWDRREILPVQRLDSRRNPLLATMLPGARGLLVAPMLADGLPAGAIVVERGGRGVLGVERRVASMLGQFASIAGLNVRNAVLLKHVQDLAERDSLTGAANRRMFQQTLERILANRANEPGQPRVTAVLFIDLDDFKVVNDSLGHAAGDELLIAVTERITKLVRESDLVARIGGDEFAILTEDDATLARSRAIAERLVSALREPYHIAGRDFLVSASIGIAGAPDALGRAPDLVRNADAAMYMAKANGKSGFALFDPAMHEMIRERHELSTELQQAVDGDQLRVVYQPIVGLEKGEMAGVEALVRWHHPERGVIMPGRFIEIAEETGAILSIGRWVLRRSCAEAGRWLADGRVPRSMFLGVNVSAREVQQPGFVDGVAAVLAETGLEPANLVLEITETALLRATPATVSTLDELRAMGVRTVIDDFGTGYFSLSHLRQLPVDVLKIASEFVQDEDPTSRSSTLAGAVVALGRSLHIDTVAEGIETAAQAARMRDLGCSYGQGYFFAWPMPQDQLLAYAAALGGAAGAAGTATTRAPDREVAPAMDGAADTAGEPTSITGRRAVRPRRRPGTAKRRAA